MSWSNSLGVFTQVDSVQGSAVNPFTMNRFLYALANPATLIDPDGHRACLEDDSGRCVADADTDKLSTTRQVTSSKPTSCSAACASVGQEVHVVGGLYLAPDDTLMDPDQFDMLNYCDVIWPPPTVGACAYWWNTKIKIDTYVTNTGGSPADFGWASPVLIEAAHKWMTDYGSSLADASSVNLRISEVRTSAQIYEDSKVHGTGLRFQVSAWQKSIATPLKIGGRVLWVLGIGTDFVEGAKHRLDLDEGHILDPTTRAGRAGIQGVARVGGGALGVGGGGLTGAWACGFFGMAWWACGITVLALAGGGSLLGAEAAQAVTDYGFRWIDQPPVP